MKLHLPVTSALPAALAAGSIALSLLILPGGGSPARSSSVAPALKLVAGDVVAVVSSPVRAVTHAAKPKTNPVAPAATGGAATAATTGVAATAVSSQSSAPTSTRSRPAHHQAARPAHHGQVSHKAPVPAAQPPASTQVVHASPKPAALSVADRGNGKAKALGHAKKTATTQTSPRATAHAPAQNAGAHSPVKAHGRPADVPHGPPAVPPGQEKHDQDAAPPDSSGKGGGKK